MYGPPTTCCIDFCLMTARTLLCSVLLFSYAMIALGDNWRFIFSPGQTCDCSGGGPDWIACVNFNGNQDQSVVPESPSTSNQCSDSSGYFEGVLFKSFSANCGFPNHGIATFFKETGCQFPIADFALNDNTGTCGFNLTTLNHVTFPCACYCDGGHSPCRC